MSFKLRHFLYYIILIAPQVYAMNLNGRALHFVFKIGNRTESIKFFREILGMKVLRHEEFTEGCEAQCNGPYDGRWSKTMIGYGIEDTHFAMELTYNYNVHSYELGNDFLGIVIASNTAINNAKKHNWPLQQEGVHSVLKSPDGYPFYLLDEPPHENADLVRKVILASSNLEKSVQYWHEILGLELLEKTDKSAVFAFNQGDAKLELRDIGCTVDHKTAFGRIAFSVPENELKLIDNKIKETGHKILTDLIKLDTPGKATVTVIILADPDGHEICFVDDGGFRALSAFDPEGNMLLDRYIKKDEERVK